MTVPPERSRSPVVPTVQDPVPPTGVGRGERPDDPAVALAAAGLRVKGSPVTLTLTASLGLLTVWLGEDSDGTAELSLALAGRFRAEGSILLLGRPASLRDLRQDVVVARVFESIEPEPRLMVSEYLATCEALHSPRHNRVGRLDALADVGAGSDLLGRAIEDLSPADLVRVCVAGALLSRPVAVVADRIDRGVLSGDWASLCRDLTAAADTTGVAIVASSARPCALEEL